MEWGELDSLGQGREAGADKGLGILVAARDLNVVAAGVFNDAVQVLFDPVAPGDFRPKAPVFTELFELAETTAVGVGPCETTRAAP